MHYRDVEDLYEAMREDLNFFDLRRGKNPLVPGEGAQPAGVFIVGEAPGADEVMALRPFVGASGQVLRQLMAIARLASEDQYEDGRDFPPTAGGNCWLTNAVKYRPPRNRTPYMNEIKAARPYLLEEWRLVGKPRVIVTLGAAALSAIRGQSTPIAKFAGKMVIDAQHGRVLWPMFHPAYGLRGSEALRTRIEQDWERLAGWLDENRPR